MILIICSRYVAPCRQENIYWVFSWGLVMQRWGRCIHLLLDPICQQKIAKFMCAPLCAFAKLLVNIIAHCHSIGWAVAVIRASAFHNMDTKLLGNITHYAPYFHYRPFARIHGSHNIALHPRWCYGSHKTYTPKYYRSSLNGLIKIMGLLGNHQLYDMDKYRPI